MNEIANNGMSKPTVLLTGKLPPPYIGPSVATQLLLNSKLNDEFELIHFDISDHRDINTLAALDVQNFYLAFKHYALLVRLILKHEPDLVYVPAGQTTIGYGRDAGFILIAKLLGRKVLCHLRGGNFKNWYESASPLTQLMVRKVHSLVDGQIVLGNNLKELFNWLMPDDRIFVVPNGGNYPDALLNGEAKSDTFRVLFLSSLKGTKGVLELLKAAPDVYERHKNVEFLFAGSWRDEETKRQFEAFMDAHPDLPVRALGPVKGQEKFDLYASSDVFVMPTYYPNEGHPWVIVEAMHYSLPIISTHHAAIPETVKDEVNGFLVEKRNPRQVAERIVQLIEDPELKERMGKESRRRYLSGFTEEKMLERMSDAFWQVINGEPRQVVQIARG